ncbi:F0F1 ATP synthase subunit B [Crocinitomicaceae bacterium CZZ-1]|uniref:ATP synthase subunit b n=1 Tax=Taishania pollutisoli TaxID=2766479 RepID=A0A8J6PIP4_9FLAO|nr:F0F1 ATP synthase subunit B [Taishania pollutisoli]MBC9812329.1 F0F1 ATP synthase subunit B [Taishania pollutisoli]MBX2950306.1 F0F1 ATP synthase subunit B [Crocinitomicaceae bacterium]NGF74314.1 F0F1 ATP synthase subunit B [Fluviicola sp. SGL-29]
MDLITPDLGLLFWTGLVFIALLFILTKFAWKPILNMVNTREQKITEALELAEKTKAEMQLLAAQNEELVKEARKERDAMIKDAKATADKMVDDAKNKAKEEAEKVLESARTSINAEKAAAIAELKAQMAAFSIEIAEKVVRENLSSDEKQKALADKLAGEINLN